MDALEDFERDHAVWDPMPLWDGKRFLLYVLAMDRSRGIELGRFFTRANTIHAFESTDLKTWKHLGVAFHPRTEQERLCAGNPLFHDGKYWFFGSAPIDQHDDDHLDQRLFLAVSDDGLNFEELPEFVLEPDPEICPHRRFHPTDGRMLFAWRDPWPIYDPFTKRFCVFVCTGGERWGRPPDVVVAVADKLAGPYTLIGSVLDIPTDPNVKDSPAFREIERVNVIVENDRYYMTFSCWRRLVNEKVLDNYSRIDEPLNDFSVYVGESGSMIGPYRFSTAKSPVVKTSHVSGFYGTTFFGKGDQQLHAIGWDWPAFRIDPTRLARLDVVPDMQNRGSALQMRWSLGRAIAMQWRAIFQAITKLATKPMAWSKKLMGRGEKAHAG